MCRILLLCDGTSKLSFKLVVVRNILNAKSNPFWIVISTFVT